MYLSPIDWTIIIVYLVGCIIAGVWMKRYVRGVEDFAVAGREMDMNMGIASLAATEFGIVTVMYTAEQGFTGGFTGAMPGILTAVAMFVVGMSGFVIDPLRKAGVITIPELFEKRFGVRVRWLAGLVIILGGVLNMGVFLRVGGEFIVGVTGLGGRQSAQIEASDLPSDPIPTETGLEVDSAPEASAVNNDAPLEASADNAVAHGETDPADTTFGWEIKGFWGTVTFGPLELTMISLLAIVLLYTVLGGMVSVLVTDYIQFIVMSFGIVLTSILVITHFGWSNICEKTWEGHRNACRLVYVDTVNDEIRISKPDDATQPFDEPVVLKIDEVKELIRKNATAGAGGKIDYIAGLDPNDLARLIKSPPSEPEELLIARGVPTRLNDGSAGQTIAMTNPMDPFCRQGVGFWWIFWQSLHALAVVTTWQTTISRVLAAKDSLTAKRIYRRTAFFWVGRWMLPGLWGAAAFVFFYMQGGLPAELKPIEAMPHFVREVLPIGVVGIVLAAMLAAEMSTDSSYLLTWATVIYNDLIIPLLRFPLSDKGRLFLVRSLVVAIGVFLVFYGLVYQIPGNTWDYLSVTGNIYLASLLALLTGALYWKKANSCGGYAAIILGASGPLAFLVVNVVKKNEAWMTWFESVLGGTAYGVLARTFEFLSMPETAGLGAFALAFGGMIVGSWIGNAFGIGICGEIPTAEGEERGNS